MPAPTSRLLGAFVFAVLLCARAEAGRYPTESWIPNALSLSLDGNRSGEMGAEDVIALNYATGRLEDTLIKLQYWREERFWAKVGGFGYRLGRFVWLREVVNFYGATGSHEYFGHGFRAREFGYTDIKYELGNPPPLGRGGGQTSFHFGGGVTTWDRAVAMSMAGVEAEGVIADRMRLAWLATGSLDAYGARLYLETRNNLRFYLAVTNEGDLRDTSADLSNDMLSYIAFLNRRNNGTAIDSWPLRLKRIEAEQNWALVDPFMWYSVWGVFASHLWQAKSFFHYPAIPLGPVRFLPSVGYGLAPWGPEYRWEALLGWDARALVLAYRVGDDSYRRSYGWDLLSSGLMRAGGCILDLDAHFWQQPRFIQTVSGTVLPTPREAGWAATLNVMSPQLSRRFPLRLSGGAGWKTAGYVRGKDLGEGAYWRIGLAWTPGRSRPQSDSI